MSQSRRRFISALGVGLVAPTTFLPQDVRPKRSRWDLILSSHDTEPAPVKPTPSSWDDATITAAWLGHATVLVNFFGTTIITDPVFSNRIGISLLGLTTIGPNRLVEPALTFEELPPIDLILLSHAHMDHLDGPSLGKFSRDIPVILAKNTIDVVDHFGWKKAHELDWGEKIVVGDVEVEAVRVKHFGWRYPWEVDRSKGNWEGRSFNAYVISRDGKRIVFGGDTAYQEYFKRLANDKQPIELALMPIGAYDPWIFNHANPEQALEMARHMGARAILPMHWRTFVQSDEPTMEPIERLKNAIDGAPLELALDSIGQTWSLNKESLVRQELP
jgi:L-ascorbate metabolism protein UlaG (beta-lactamase superfamily)